MWRKKHSAGSRGSPILRFIQAGFGPALSNKLAIISYSISSKLRGGTLVSPEISKASFKCRTLFASPPLSPTR